MGWFDRFRNGPPPEEPLKRISIGVAHFLIPDLVFRNYANYVRFVATPGGPIGERFYATMARLARLPVDPEAGRRFLWKVGELESGLAYQAMIYPEPAPLIDEREVCVSTNPAPWFSALISRPGSKGVRYFILEQSFRNDRTTLHEKVAGGTVPGGTDYNLGPGPAPTLKDFLESVRCFANPTAKT